MVRLVELVNTLLFNGNSDKVLSEETILSRFCMISSVQIDGFEQEKKVVVVAATNRKQDLDPALLRYLSSLVPLYFK